MITIQNLSRTYGSLQAVDNITLEIPDNTIYGIIGKSGAGKSTLVRLISLLEKPDAGTVFYGDRRVDNLAGMELLEQRRRIGMIFQNFNLFSSRTAARNVAYPLEICGCNPQYIKERVSELLNMVGLGDRADAPVSTLSGGQKQRIAIARALANKPDILFCDEATSALDPQTTRSILELIRELQHKMSLTVVMITHQMEVVRDACDHVAVIDNGSVVEKGAVTDIFASPKTEVTKDFLSHLSSMAENATGTPRALVRWSQIGGRYILRFKGEKTGEPVLSRLSRQFAVEYNIRAGGIQTAGGADVGTLIVDFTGDPHEIKDAVAYLEHEGITVELDESVPPPEYQAMPHDGTRQEAKK